MPAQDATPERGPSVQGGDDPSAQSAGDSSAQGRDGSSAPAWSLRPATLEDVEEIAFAELELFPDEAWSVFQLAEEIEHPDRRYVVAVDARAGDGPASLASPVPGGGAAGEGPLLGYAGIMLAGDIADLHTIGTRVARRGIGRALLAWCEEQALAGGAERMLLEVREDNDRARAFYTRAGYTEIGRRPGYYRIRGRRIDALVMERTLAAPGGPTA